MTSPSHFLEHLWKCFEVLGTLILIKLTSSFALKKEEEKEEEVGLKVGPLVVST